MVKPQSVFASDMMHIAHMALKWLLPTQCIYAVNIVNHQFTWSVAQLIAAEHTHTQVEGGLGYARLGARLLQTAMEKE